LPFTPGICDPPKNIKAFLVSMWKADLWCPAIIHVNDDGADLTCDEAYEVLILLRSTD
jgi:hypothetical protein